MDWFFFDPFRRKEIHFSLLNALFLELNQMETTPYEIFSYILSMKRLKYVALVLSIFTGLIFLSQEKKEPRKPKGLAQTNLQFILKGFVEEQGVSFAQVQDTVAWYFDKVKGIAEKRFDLALKSKSNPTHRPGVDPNFELMSDIRFSSWKEKLAFYQNLARQEGIHIKYMPGKGGGIAGLVDLSLPMPDSEERLEVKNVVFILGAHVFERA